MSRRSPPAIAIAAGTSGTAAFDVSASDPDADFHVEISADVLVTAGTVGSELALTGSSVDLLEALSFRQPLQQPIPQELDWAFAGLATAFDR